MIFYFTFHLRSWPRARLNVIETKRRKTAVALHTVINSVRVAHCVLTVSPTSTRTLSFGVNFIYSMFCAWSRVQNRFRLWFDDTPPRSGWWKNQENYITLMEESAFRRREGTKKGKKKGKTNRKWSRTIDGSASKKSSKRSHYFFFFFLTLFGII